MIYEDYSKETLKERFSYVVHEQSFQERLKERKILDAAFYGCMHDIDVQDE